MWVIFLLLAAVVSPMFGEVEEYKIDVEECKAAGFNPETLKVFLLKILAKI